MKNINKTIQLHCGLCGSLDFRVDRDNDTYQCSYCNELYSKEEIMDLNKELIENTKNELAQKAQSEINKEVKKMFKGILK